MDRSCLYLLLAVVLLSTCSYVALGSGEFFLYLYGATWCPYCRALGEFFSKSFPDSSYFCKIDVDSSCRDALELLKGYLESKGVPENVTGYVPLTLVVVEGRYVAAIVVGAVTDAAFWVSLARAAPRERVPVMLVREKVYEVRLTYEEQALISRMLQLLLAQTPTVTVAPITVTLPVTTTQVIERYVPTLIERTLTTTTTVTEKVTEVTSVVAVAASLLALGVVLGYVLRGAKR